MLGRRALDLAPPMHMGTRREYFTDYSQSLHRIHKQLRLLTDRQSLSMRMQKVSEKCLQSLEALYCQPILSTWTNKGGNRLPVMAQHL